MRGVHSEVRRHPAGGGARHPARPLRGQDPHTEGRDQGGQASRTLLQEAAQGENTNNS